jgi:hypothetical protein
MAGDFHIRTMTMRDVALALDWAAAEGWNPGWADADCFACVDPTGFLIGRRQDEPVSTISAVNYDERFAFLGFYIVRTDLRGRGLGLRTWEAAIAHAGTRTIGLDGVAAQQQNYRKSGFELAYFNIRYGGKPTGLRSSAETIPLSEVPFDAIERDDATVFPATRSSFLRRWTVAPGHVARAILRNGQLVAWGVARPCRRGRKIGPLFADDRAAAEAVFTSLAGRGQEEIFLDVPQPNEAAVALAAAAGLAPVFQTARMYSGPIRPVALERVFGVTSFELG